MESGPWSWSCVNVCSGAGEQLTGQVSEKQNIGARGRQIDEQQQKQHFESWETFWGRPGNGAPRDSSQKENLMKMLHYPENSNKVGIGTYKNCISFYRNFSRSQNPAINFKTTNPDFE